MPALARCKQKREISMNIKTRDFLVEIGTEELPPKSLLELSNAFAEGLRKGLGAAQLSHGDVQRFATPRRLAVIVKNLIEQQPDQQVKRNGPAVSASFDAHGAPTKAALGFAASCGVNMDALQQGDGPKGKVLLFEATQRGLATDTLLAGIVETALDTLPIARRMRWGAGDAQFVRPVHWVTMLFGNAIVDANILGVAADNQTHGHRFHAPQAIKINNPENYASLLKNKGHVIADFAERREVIRNATNAAAEAIGGKAVIDDALLNEVTALVEWPVSIAGRFEERFLTLPAEVPIATMQDHQRYFPVRDYHGKLMPWFIATANIDSNDPNKIRQGNERVIRPRLADAAFFFDLDRKQPLSARIDALKNVTFQKQLGSVHDKSQRVRMLAGEVAVMIGGKVMWAQRAADLSKCDLLSAMVGEFPELQGLMGKYYATHDQESQEVCAALEEQYRPRFAGDTLPRTATGTALALADKLDTIVGIFAIGQPPSGTRDPFGLRRAALGILRITIEKRLEVDLIKLIDQACAAQPVPTAGQINNDVYNYVMERLRSYYIDGESGLSVTSESFDAVLVNRPHSPLDFDARLRALAAFLQRPEAPSLAAAHKRINNILRKAGHNEQARVQAELLTETAEKTLHEQITAMSRTTEPLFASRDYTNALSTLAGLRTAVDDFFDRVMVMAEDAQIKNNRLALLSQLRELFLRIADLSRLPG